MMMLMMMMYSFQIVMYFRLRHVGGSFSDGDCIYGNVISISDI
jgi:hypothetical protein